MLAQCLSIQTNRFIQPKSVKKLFKKGCAINTINSPFYKHLIQYQKPTIMKTILLFFALCIAGIANATTYYISPIGDDIRGDGSRGNPWQTLNKATTAVTTPGDVIFVTAGDYLEIQVCNLSVGVSIDGAGPTSVIKSSVTTPWTAIINAGSTVSGTNGNQYIANIKMDGRFVNAWGIVVSCRSNVSIYNCTFVDIKERGVFWPAVSNTGQNTEPAIYSTGNKFYNNTMINCAEFSGGWGRGMLNIGGQDGMLIYDNTFILDRPSGQNGYCIKYLNDGWLRGIKIYNNTFTKTPIGGVMGANDWPFAIEFAHTTGGVEIYNNVFTGAGIDANVQYQRNYPYSMWIHHNIIKNLTPNAFRQAGVILEFSTEGVIIENNVMDNITYGVLFTPRSITQNVWSGNIKNITIQKNLMTLVVAEGGGNSVFFYADAGAQFQYNYDSIKIYNNTMIYKPGYASPWGIGLPFSAPGGSIKNIEIKNNIMANTISGAVAHCGTCGSVVPDRVTISNNNTYNSGNANMPVWLGSTPTNYNYNDNLYITPVYGPDYTLMAGSPMIDVGLQVGLPYSGAAPDKGYFEYGFSLPISLLDFTVKENGSKNILNWKTATESNSSHFSVERSSDGVNFSSIGRVNASGNSSTEKMYSYVDANPLPASTNYYRLKMIDLDASFEYSKIVSVKNKTADQSLDLIRVNLSTNNNTATLVLNSKKTQTANLSIYDASGKVYFNSQISIQTGNTTIVRDILAIIKGIYYIKLFTPEETFVKSTFTQD